MAAISSQSTEVPEPNKLILCFDGTGNTFSGSNADTNVVKILNKLDRQHPKQFHYYQTGVGTYDVNETSVNKSWLGEIRSSLFMTRDQAFGTTFDAHVMAGYRFLMRYYRTGDKIYMFGFSRGAYTAKFLARMIHTVGLLCKGNEEMVPFAYRLYQRYLAGEVDDYEHATPSTGGPQTNGDTRHEDHGETYQLARNEVIAFSNTFCRVEPTVIDGETVEANVKVYFLGIWDCVNSVAFLEGNAPKPVPVKGTAHHVRHAVAADERRVKFKPALIAQDTRASTQILEDIKEVWFPGCHGDVGGGWPATEADNLAVHTNTSLWQRIKNFWTTTRAKEATKDIRKDAFQMSDVALSWMIRELELVNESDPSAALNWSKNVEGYKRAFATELHQTQALKGIIHDSLVFGGGAGFTTVLLWKFMEILPIITRWELKDDKWERKRFPLNKGSYRDIPCDAVLHESLKYRLKNIDSYCPGNNHGGNLPPCLKLKNEVPPFIPITESTSKVSATEVDPCHQTYTFPKGPKASEVQKPSRSCSVM